MAPVLFLFMIMAFAEILEKEWEKVGLEMVQMRQHSHFPRDVGQLTNQKRTKFSEGSLLSLFCIMYVDDGAFTFESREHMEIGINLIFSHFTRFCLEMHIIRGTKVSKTECVFFPPQVTTPIQVADGRVIFCSHFKYLGSWISFSLRDDSDITRRLFAANASYGRTEESMGGKACR